MGRWLSWAALVVAALVSRAWMWRADDPALDVIYARLSAGAGALPMVAPLPQLLARMIMMTGWQDRTHLVGATHALGILADLAILWTLNRRHGPVAAWIPLLGGWLLQGTWLARLDVLFGGALLLACEARSGGRLMGVTVASTCHWPALWLLGVERVRDPSFWQWPGTLLGAAVGLALTWVTSPALLSLGVPTEPDVEAWVQISQTVLIGGATVAVLLAQRKKMPRVSAWVLAVAALCVAAPDASPWMAATLTLLPALPRDSVFVPRAALCLCACLGAFAVGMEGPLATLGMVVMSGASFALWALCMLEALGGVKVLGPLRKAR